MKPFLERWPRRIALIGGPLDGTAAPLAIPDKYPDPPSICHGHRGVWWHYTQQDNGAYLWVGECSEGNHDGYPLPDEHRCCCGESHCGCGLHRT